MSDNIINKSLSLFSRRGLRFLSVAAALVVGAPLAQARTVPASDFSPQYGHEYSCWIPGWGQMFNGCRQSEPLSFPLSVDTAGIKTVRVNVIAPNANANVSCFVLSSNRDGTNQFRTAARGAPAFGGAQQIVFSGLNVIAGGLLVVDCEVDPNASVLSIEYNQ